ncbi:hypothetical protein P154DRAFT_493412 [Amniculicola lignicola CBS 123094]|uniref:Histone chaperone domain-containing protein n=1 Tax=Amniculicola lignicola CBS 123094 TaxID=1392246 RepID=A0A6A5WQ01_9PLEO|nr:hypothetical protein P154DRAFT_493412 [Amniculicola lignicola CBS 123094]
MSANIDDNQNGPAGNPTDNDYISRTGQSEIPVQKDEAPVGDVYEDGPADSDEQLGNNIARDEKDAIDEDNILSERTRGAAKTQGTYTEPGDEEGLPGPEDGTSST